MSDIIHIKNISVVLNVYVHVCTCTCILKEYMYHYVNKCANRLHSSRLKSIVAAASIIFSIPKYVLNIVQRVPKCAGIF